MFAEAEGGRPISPGGNAPAPEMSDTKSPVRTSAWEWMRVGILSANIAWTTLCLGGFLPGARVLMAVLTGALIGVHFADPRRGVRAHPAGWLFIPFLAYAAANVAWVSPVRWLGLEDWFGWAQAAAIYWIVLNGVEAPACRRFLCSVLAALGFVAAVLAAYQHFVRPDWIMLGRTQADQYAGRSSGPFGIPNSLGVFMALLIPPAGAQVFGPGRTRLMRALCAVVLAALVTGFVLAVSRGAWLALAVAFALKPLVSTGLKPGRRVAGAAAALAVVLVAGAVLYVSFPIMHERIDQLVRDSGELTRPILWRAAWRIFEGHKLLGGGGGSFDALFEAFRPEHFINQPFFAHSDYLNTLSDYGAVGFMLLFGAAGAVAWGCSRARGLAGAAFTGLVAFALHLLVDFHMKIPALSMIVATIAALVTSEAWHYRVRTRHAGIGRLAARAAALCAAAGGFSASVLWIAPKHEAQEIRRAARERIDKMAKSAVDVSGERVALTAIRREFARSARIDPTNAQTLSDEAYADSLWALVEPRQTVELGAEVEREARAAVALCPVISEFWIRLGTGLDMQRRWIDGGACFVRALQLAPYRADVWYYQAYHLSLAPNEAGPAIAACDLSLRLDPGFLLAQVLRQRLEAQIQPPR